MNLKFNKIRTMSKRKTEYKCPNDGCSKIFKEEGINDVNFKRHVETCKHRKEMCTKRSDITNYFKSANTQTVFDEDASMHELEIDSSSHVKISENTEVINFDKGKQCQGFLVSFDSGSVLSLSLLGDRNFSMCSMQFMGYLLQDQCSLIHVKIVIFLLPLIQVLRIVLYKIKTMVRSMRRLAQLSHLRWMKLQQNHVCEGVAKIIRLLDYAININTLDDALKIKDLLDSDRIHKTK